MEPFIRSDQYNFIKLQLRNLIGGHASVNDIDVLKALDSLAAEKSVNVFEDLTAEQQQILEPISSIRDKTEAAEYLAGLKEYVIPFWHVTDMTVKKLFPKAKKLKLPPLDAMDLKETTYIGWDDIGSGRKFLIVPYENKLIGLSGTYSSISQRGLCHICSRFSDVGMFMTEKKGPVQDTFIKRGNYICQDSLKCNSSITSLDKLNDFVGRLK
ncbi:FusB/FusC family EF-G-binding protein [Metabacillus sp. GX 13764]|uniref:FusB/FusC family EF-G-binding protein n=1 Tax=Metabacillus kandeliae TaxID=2900151 RepID=UPI001E3C6612|nr:FusB/FusC family EF-G-binding protein [Metabacillus kandeliae]MCD7034032.1 FusB/FusC family EF-G-binding protein [Metabacillus kandeliae]